MTYSVHFLFLYCYLLNVDTVAQFGNHGMRKRSMLDDDPCLDAHQVENLDSVELLPRYAHLKRPWMRTDVTPKVFTSDGLRYQWMWAKSLVVRGLSNDTTVDDILRFLDSQNCSFLAIGDAVWQTVHRIHPVRFEGEISCSMKELYTVCLSKYGNSACSLFPLGTEGPSKYKLEIGDARADRSLDELKAKPLVLYEWGSTLGLPAQRWGYTVTTMAIYDNNAGQVYLIDMTGRGYMDTCGKRISAAVDNSQWKAWADGDISKVYRFYLLRTQGFGVSNHDLQNFINKMIQSESSKKIAQTFYCESILGGIVSWAGDGLTTTCHVVYPDSTDRHRIVSARDLLSSEMGAHWIVNTAPAIDEMEAVYLTERQFVDVRDRLKGRITGGSRRQSESGVSTRFTPIMIDSVESYAYVITTVLVYFSIVYLVLMCIKDMPQRRPYYAYGYSQPPPFGGYQPPPYGSADYIPKPRPSRSERNGAYDPNYQTLASIQDPFPPPRPRPPAKKGMAGAYDPNYQTLANIKGDVFGADKARRRVGGRGDISESAAELEIKPGSGSVEGTDSNSDPSWNECGCLRKG